jgi:hypothetical protein
LGIEDSWPRVGDKLFDTKGDWWNAFVGWSHERWHGYVEGYRKAADILVEHVGETHRSQDHLIYPIVFLYRHALEVSLKRLLYKGAQLLDLEVVIPRQHRLLPLWNECRPILEEVWPSGPTKDLDAVAEVLAQFDAKDPSSTAFRYPIDTTGRASQETSEQIDIRNFAEVSTRVLTMLDCCDSGFSEYLDYKSEMERESAW